jgi:hypothetical protein
MDDFVRCIREAGFLTQFVYAAHGRNPVVETQGLGVDDRKDFTSPLERTWSAGLLPEAHLPITGTPISNGCRTNMNSAQKTVPSTMATTSFRRPPLVMGSSLPSARFLTEIRS